MNSRILIVGYRQGLARALEGRGLPYAVWNHQPLRTLDPAIPTLIAPFGNSVEASREAVKCVASLGEFSHVIAGSEASVVAASFARRVLGARRSKHTTIVRCHDKLSMKEHLQQFDIPMAPFGDGNDPEEVRRLAEVSRRIVVKDRRSSGGRGIQIIEGSEADRQVATRNRIVEGFIEAPEMSVESFIHEGTICFTNITEYAERTTVNVAPGALAKELVDRILDLNRRVIEALAIRWGMTHLEVYLTEAGPLFGEIALRPPGGYIMEMLPLAYDFDAWDAFLSVELGEEPVLHRNANAIAAAVVLHPGAGTLERIDGRKAAAQIPGVERIHLRVQVGDQIEPRSGVGEDIGYVLVRAGDRAALDETLAELKATLVFGVARGARPRNVP